MALEYRGMVIRPPSEARSFLLQTTYGCSHNRCTFCITYKNSKFEVRTFEKVEEDIKLAADMNPRIRRVFICDGNAMCLSTSQLLRILESLEEHFPNLERVGIYANSADILSKSEEELASLSDHKLRLAYLGLESGNNNILKMVNKGATAEEMIEAVQRAQGCGIDMSVIVLLGLGSIEHSEIHAKDSAQVVSLMGPRYLSALTLMRLPGTGLFQEHRKGNFDIMTPQTILKELRLLIEEIETEDCVFRTNHASNYLPLSGTLSQDSDTILNIIDNALENPDTLRPESFRAL